MAYPERKVAPRRKRRLGHENRVFLLALGSGSLAVAIALLVFWLEPHDAKTRWTVTLAILAVWLGFALAVRDTVARPLQTLANMQAALREGDFSMRMRRSATQ